MDNENKMYILYKVTEDYQVLFGYGSNLNEIKLNGPPIYDHNGSDKVKTLKNQDELEDNLISFILSFIEKPSF
jgi:hypothetical protein